MWVLFAAAVGGTTQVAVAPGLTAPSLLVPGLADRASRDSLIESPAAPLLVPGQPNPADSARRTPAERAREHFRLAESLERAGQPGAAIIAYDNALQLDPAIPQANHRIGLLYLTRDQIGEAVRYFAAELRHHPETHDASRELGLGFARLGDTTRAIARLEDLTRRRPDDDESWRALGFAYSTAGRPRDAEVALRRAIGIEPARAVEHRDLAVLLSSYGRNGEARDEYEKAIALDPGEPTVWYNLANMHRRVGELERALSSFRRAVALDSTLALAMRGEVETLLDLGRETEAGDVYRRWLDASPEDHETRLDAVLLYGRLGRAEVASRLAVDGVTQDPRSAEARVILGVVLEAQGDPSGALVEMRAALQLLRGAADRERILGWITAIRSPSADSLKRLLGAENPSPGKAFDLEGPPRNDVGAGRKP